MQKELENKFSSKYMMLMELPFLEEICMYSENCNTILKLIAQILKAQHCIYLTLVLKLEFPDVNVKLLLDSIW
jgi:hypothetical protein